MYAIRSFSTYLVNVNMFNSTLDEISFNDC